MFRVECTLYSSDGLRSAEVCLFANGETYLREWETDDQGIRVARHSGSMVGPFPSPEQAERFITATTWFNGPT